MDSNPKEPMSPVLIVKEQVGRSANEDMKRLMSIVLILKDKVGRILVHLASESARLLHPPQK